MNKERKLISGGYIVTMNAQEDIIENGWILMEKDRIVGIGSGTPPEPKGDTEKIDGSGKVVLPGIVNVHTHVCGSLFKALTEDTKDSFYSLAFPMERFLTPETTYILSMLGCIESVKFGSTCINDLYHHMRHTAKAVEEIGLRGVLAQKVYEVNLCNLQYNDYAMDPAQGERKLEENVRLIEEYHHKGNGRITCRFGPHATDTVSIKLAQKISDLAEQFGVGIHIHAAQKEREVRQVGRAYNLTPAEYLKESGLAGSKLIAAHCLLLKESDIEIMKNSGTNIAHCPQIVLKRGNFPPIKAFYENNLNIALGTDWVSMNPWDNMRFAIAGARVKGCDEDCINAKKAFRMATIGAAKVIGMENSIGSLEVGKKADLLIMNVHHAHLQPIFDNLMATIVYNANGNEIETVIIDGQTVVKDGRMATVDEEAVLVEASKVARDLYRRQLNSK